MKVISDEIKEFLNDSRPINEYRDFDNFLCEKLLTNAKSSNENPVELLYKISKDGPRQVCQYQFKHNDIVWVCRNCQKDDTCVLCNDCYSNSTSHVGHDVFFYHSTAGGCCDCGNPDAWNDCKAFCCKHGQIVDDPIQFIPNEIKEIGEVIFPQLVDWVVRCCEEYAQTYELQTENLTQTEEEHFILLNHDEYHTMAEYNEFVERIVVEVLPNARLRVPASFPNDGSLILLRSTDIVKIKALAAYCKNKGFQVNINSTKMVVQIRNMIYVVTWLQKIAQCNDGFCKLVANAVNVAYLARILLIDMYLPKNASRPIYNWLMSMMADQQFKMTIARVYAHCYNKFATQFCNGWGSTTQSLFSLSVQFLNRDIYVNEIAVCHSFLGKVIQALNEMFQYAKRIGGPNHTNWLNHPVLTKRRYNPLVGDLKIVFTIPGVSRYFLTTCLARWLDFLMEFQWMHSHIRSVIQHVVYEDTLWISAFNLSLGVSSCFSNQFSWFSDASASVSERMQYGSGINAEAKAYFLQSEALMESAVRTSPIIASPSASSSSQQQRDPMMAIATAPTGTDEAPSPHSNRSAGGSTTPSSRSSGFFGRLIGMFRSNSISPRGGSTATTTHSAYNDSIVKPSATDSRVDPFASQEILLIGVYELLSLVYGKYLHWIFQVYAKDNQYTLQHVPELNDVCGILNDFNIAATRNANPLLTHFTLFPVPSTLSFHLPMNRFLALAILDGCCHAHLEESLHRFQKDITHQQEKLAVAIDIPLQVIVFALQIRVGLWRRNGMNMVEQQLNYTEIPFCRIHRDIDLLLIQFALQRYPANTFVRQLVYRFDLHIYLLKPAECVHFRDCGFYPQLLDEMLRLLINILTELPLPAWEGSNYMDRFRPSLRREFIHELIHASAPFSKLQERLSLFQEHTKFSTEFIEDIVKEIATRVEVGGGLGPPVYALKKNLWEEYDPCFFHMSDAAHQTAVEHRPKLTKNTSLAPPLLPTHSCFSDVRKRLLFDSALWMLIQKILTVQAYLRNKQKYSAIKEFADAFTHAENTYLKALQLISMALHVVNNNNSASATAVSSNTATNCDTTMSNDNSFMLKEFLTNILQANPLFNGTKLPYTILEVLLDLLADSSSSTVDVNLKYWLGWIVDQLRTLSPTCDAIISKSLNESATASEAIEKQADLRMQQARDKATKDLQANAAKFLAMMEGMSDSDEDNDETAGTGDGAEGADTTGAAEMTENKPDNADAVSVKSESAPSVNSNNGGGGGGGTGATSKASLAAGETGTHGATPLTIGATATTTAEDDINTPTCIVCQVAYNPVEFLNNVGYLAMTSASTVLQTPTKQRTLHILEKKETIQNIVSQDVHFQFCGHAVHFNCFESYFQATLAKSQQQDHMFFDASKNQFPCPLCKKLNNVLIPHIPLCMEVGTVPAGAEAVGKRVAGIAMSPEQINDSDSNNGNGSWVAWLNDPQLLPDPNAMLSKPRPATLAPGTAAAEEQKQQKAARDINDGDAMEEERAEKRQKLSDDGDEDADAAAVANAMIVEDADTTAAVQVAGDTANLEHAQDQEQNHEEHQAAEKRELTQEEKDLLSFIELTTKDADAAYKLERSNPFARMLNAQLWKMFLIEFGYAPSFEAKFTPKETFTYSFRGKTVDQVDLLVALERILGNVVYTLCNEVTEDGIPGLHIAVRSQKRVVSDSSSSGSAAGAGAGGGAMAGNETSLASASSAGVAASVTTVTATTTGGGFDYDRYIEKVIDGIGAALFYLDLHHVMETMLLDALCGLTNQSNLSLTAVKQAKITLGPLHNEYIHWLKFDQEVQELVPLLKLPLLEVLVLALAIVKIQGLIDFQTPFLKNNATATASGGAWFKADVQRAGHLYHWFAVAKLVQLLVDEIGREFKTAPMGRAPAAIAEEWPTVAPLLQTILARLNAPVHPSSDLVRYVLYKWCVYLRAASHTLLRNSSIVDDMVRLQPALWNDLPADVTALTDEMVGRFVTASDLRDLLTLPPDIAAAISEAVGNWMADVAHCAARIGSNSVDEGKPSSSAVSAGSTSSGSVQSGAAANANASTVADEDTTTTMLADDAVREALAAQLIEDSVINNNNATLEDVYRRMLDLLNVFKNKSTPKTLLQQGRDHSLLTLQRKSLIDLEYAYTQFHSRITTMCSFEAPAVCLICGAVVNAGGKGCCSAHISNCSGDVGIFFLLQECMVLLFHGTRAAYFPAPYVDAHGESQQGFRGKPLFLNPARYESLRKLWVSHGIAREVHSKRSASTRIVMQGYY